MPIYCTAPQRARSPMPSPPKDRYTRLRRLQLAIFQIGRTVHSARALTIRFDDNGPLADPQLGSSGTATSSDRTQRAPERYSNDILASRCSFHASSGPLLDLASGTERGASLTATPAYYSLKAFGDFPAARRETQIYVKIYRLPYYRFVG
jgi:hypothetical protein